MSARSAGALLALLGALTSAVASASSDVCPAAESSVLRAAPGPAAGGLDAIAGKFTRRIKRITRGGDAPGIAVAVIEQGHLSWQSAAGSTQRRGDTPFSAATVVPLGRLSEIPIALQALRLAREGRLDLDAPIQSDLPELQRSEWPLPSVRQLLAHQGGLNGGRLHDLYVNQSEPRPAPSPVYPIRAPGVLESYSLVGYRLAFDAIEAAAGGDLRQRILDDLGRLRAPHCAPSVFRYQIADDEGRGHLDGKTLDSLAASEPRVLGLRANLHGLIDLIAPLTKIPQAGQPHSLSGSALQQSDFDTLIRPGPGAKLDFDRRSGLSFTLAQSQREGVGLVALSFGQPPGYRIEIRIAVEHQIATIMVATGGDEDDLDDLGSDLLDAVLSARKGLPAREEDPPLPDFVALPAEVGPAPWAQRYATPIGRLRIEEFSDDGFDFEILGKAFRARAREDGWYQISYRLLGVIPLRFSILRRTLLHSASWEGESLLLAHVWGNTVLVGSAVGAEKAPRWSDAWLGDYRLRNPDLLSELLELETVRLGNEDQHLYIEYQLPFFLDLKPRVLLHALGNDRLVVSGVGPLLGERLQLREDDGGKHIEYAGYVFDRQSP